MNNLQLPTDLPQRYRYEMRAVLRFDKWEFFYQLVGAAGGLHLNISSSHCYDGEERWSAGLETHSRTPLYGKTAPDHPECWLLHGPCWHDGTSIYAQETYLPLFHDREHSAIFHKLVHDADNKWPPEEQPGDAT